MKEGTGEFTIAGWDEKPYADRKQGKLTQASVAQDFTGAVRGTGSVEWLMCYREDGTADFVGLQDIEGTVDERTGGFVLTTVGTFDGAVAAGTWSIVSGSGRAQLAGITGTGEFSAPHGGTPTFRLSYELG